jgi:hypothetical protein
MVIVSLMGEYLVIILGIHEIEQLGFSGVMYFV